MKVAVWCLLAFVVAACGGKPSSPRAAAPELHTWIPADAPYAAAMLEPMNLEYAAQVYGTYAPRFVETMRTELGASMVNKLVAELRGKGTPAGLAAMGFAAKTYFVAYGDGDAHVFRMDVKDGNALFATVEKIVKSYNEQLPPAEARGAYRLWQLRAGEHAFALALGPTQLAAAYGPPAAIDRVLPGLLGGAKPARSLADTGELFALRDGHHAGAQFVVFADTAKLIAQYAREAAQPACADAFAQLAKRIPRAVATFALLPDRHEMTVSVDTAPDLAEELMSLRVALPALAAADANVPAAKRPLMSAAIGADLVRGQKLAITGMQAVKRVAEACHAPKHIAGAEEAIAALSSTFPLEVVGITGGAVVLNRLALPPGAFLPTDLDGYMLVAGADVSRLFAYAKQAMGGFVELGFALDGALHLVPLTKLPIALPFEVHGGGTPKLLALAVGAAGAAQSSARTDAQKALAATPQLAPFLFFEGDYARLMQLKRDRDDEDDRDAGTDLSIELYSRAAAILDADKRGVKMLVRYDLKR